MFYPHTLENRNKKLYTYNNLNLSLCKIGYKCLQLVEYYWVNINVRLCKRKGISKYEKDYNNTGYFLCR